jgi:hypothetical protein
MKEELEEVFGRPVDLVEKKLIDESPNYIRRKHILTHMEPFMWRNDAYLLDMLIAAKRAPLIILQRRWSPVPRLRHVTYDSQRLS